MAKTTINTTIVRLPMYMTEPNKGLFEPRVVSIGPFHYGNKSTLNMEAHKEDVLKSFFERLVIMNHSQMIAICEPQLQCYKENIGNYDAEKLMRDGCFIIELLLRFKMGTFHVDNYVRLMSNSIYYDLLLVDNQIPFFVLTMLFKIYVDCTGNRDTPLLHLVRDFFNHKDQFSWANLKKLDLPNSDLQVHHLLDLQYKFVISNNSENESTINSCPSSICCNICHHTPQSMPRGIPGANKLRDYGVRFCVNKNQQAKMFDVTFSDKEMTIPHFQINFGSKILLANLFAYDQIVFHLAGGQATANDVGAVTSYVVLMNALVNNRDDVAVLQEEGILDNLLSNEEEVASFFNRLGRSALVDVTEHRYTGMFDDVNKYWMNSLNCCKYFAIFRMNHLRNPWTCLSLLGALMLFIFHY